MRREEEEEENDFSSSMVSGGDRPGAVGRTHHRLSRSPTIDERGEHRCSVSTSHSLSRLKSSGLSTSPATV